MTMLGVATPRAWTLTKLRTKVVSAKPQRPRGAGLANCLNNRLCGSGSKSAAEAGRTVDWYVWVSAEALSSR
jgi:hypothetical protein